MPPKRTLSRYGKTTRRRPRIRTSPGLKALSRSKGKLLGGIFQQLVPDSLLGGGGIYGDGATAYWAASEDVNGRVLKDLRGNGLHGYFGSTKAAAIMDGALVLAGVAGNYASTPDVAALDITGDIDIRCRVALTTWASGAIQILIAKGPTSGTTKAYWLDVDATGLLRLALSSTGSSLVVASSSVIIGIPNNTTKWLRATWRQSDGRVQFFLSDDGTNWTQLGTDQNISPATIPSIFSSSEALRIGSPTNDTVLAAGKFYRAQVRNGIGGSVVFDADFSTQADGTLSFAEATGKTVTVNQSAATTNDPTRLVYDGVKYLYLPGITGNYASTPDSATLDITGDLDLRVDCALTDWTPATAGALHTKGTGTTGSAQLFILTTGVLRFRWGDGVNNNFVDATVPTGLVDGTRKVIRVTLDVNNGAVGRTIRFYLADSISGPWTQLGADVVQAVVTSVAANADELRIGANSVGTELIDAKFYRTQLRNGIDGTVVFDADFNNATEPFATFTEDSANAATVTINRSATGRKAAIVDRTMLLLGTDDYLDVADNNLLDFGASDSFTVAVLTRGYGLPPSGHQVLLSKKSALGGISPGYALYNTSFGARTDGRFGDATVNDGSMTGPAVTGGVLRLSTLVRRAGTNLQVYQDTTGGTVVTDIWNTAVNTQALLIGRLPGGNYVDNETIAVAIFRRVLTTDELTTLKEELMAL